jgi:hypothetical protein
MKPVPASPDHSVPSQSKTAILGSSASTAAWNSAVERVLTARPAADAESAEAWELVKGEAVGSVESFKVWIFFRASSAGEFRLYFRIVRFLT